MSDTQPTIGERLVRLEGKIDAYAAGQSARIDEHERRLSGHDEAIGDLRIIAATHVTRDELANATRDEPTTAPAGSARPNTLTVVLAIIAAIIAGLALLAPALSALIQLVDKIAN